MNLTGAPEKSSDRPLISLVASGDNVTLLEL